MSLTNSFIRAAPSGSRRARALLWMAAHPEATLGASQGLLGGGMGYLYNRLISKDRSRRNRHVLIGAGAGAAGGILGGALTRKYMLKGPQLDILRAHASGDIDLSRLAEFKDLSRRIDEARFADNFDAVRELVGPYRRANELLIRTPRGEQFRKPLTSMSAMLEEANASKGSGWSQLLPMLGLVGASAAAPTALMADTYLTKADAPKQTGPKKKRTS